MLYLIKELRNSTGMTQKAFASQYGIPLSTLRKWEQGEASPPPYVVQLIARTLPVTNHSLKRLTALDGRTYYYDSNKRSLSDVQGNTVLIEEDLDGVNEQNLQIYIQDLFDDFYEIQSRFNRDCAYDKKENILWVRKK